MKSLIENFSLSEPHWLWLLLALIPLFFLAGKAPTHYSLNFPTLRVLSSLGLKTKEKPFRLAPLLALIALIPAIIAMARPTWGSTSTTKEASGIDIVIALDISESMAQRDFTRTNNASTSPQSRLAISKSVITEFIKKRTSDRLGLITFTDQTYPLSPLTLHHQHLLDKLEDVKIDRTRASYTALSAAIAAAAQRLEQRHHTQSKILILVTDGKDTASEIAPREIAQQAAILGIKIYTVSIAGDPQDNLAELSKITAGVFHHVTDSTSLTQAFQKIDTLEKSTLNLTTLSIQKPIHHHFITAALILLILAILHKAFNPLPAP